MMVEQYGLGLLVDKILNMKKYCLIKNKEVTQIGSLPINFENVSNFHLLSDEEIKPYGWFPVEIISENKDIIVSAEYQIEENLVKEIIITRDRNNEELQSLLQSKWQPVRFKRNSLLKDSDIEVTSDKWEDMSPETKLLWKNYRTQLRDIPQTFTNAEDVIWPIKP
jgi:hypothetical protein